jgi:putative hydrolase of the HAD superfamily
MPQIETQPDFQHIDVWVFDLDNTLYAAGCGLFGQIDLRMTQFVSDLLGTSLDHAREIQKKYYREHGTTLNGLMRLHGVDPEDYLGYVHEIDLSCVKPDAALKGAILRLKGRRFVFTNGCRRHATRVLERLELGCHFDDIWDIRTIDFRPKPDPSGYEAVLARAGTSPNRAAMFDDAQRNLATAHGLGMTTVWIKNDSEWSKQGPEFPVASGEHIDYETGDLAEFLRGIRI